MRWMKRNRTADPAGLASEGGGAARAPVFERLEDRLLLSLLGVGSELVVPLEAPLVGYDNAGSVTYTAPVEPAQGAFDVDAAPTNVVFPGDPPGFGFVSAPDLTIRLLLDGSGAIAGDANGALPDLVVNGTVTNLMTGETFTAPLLTGDIVAFGFEDTGTVTDAYDFRFSVTGGSFAPYFVNMDIGVTMTSESSSFVGNFEVAFSGEAKGNVFGIPAAAPPPPQYATIDGFVWLDADDDGEIDVTERVIEGAQVTLTGGNLTEPIIVYTDADGWYGFADLEPGTYVVTQTQPGAFEDGQDSLGTVNDVLRGDDSVNDQFAVTLEAGEDGRNYNFGERGSMVAAGQTATIGYWRNKNGQKLLKNVHEGLGSWMVATFPNMYGHLVAELGPTAGEITNAEVASYYKDQVFTMKIKGWGPTKFDAQVMGVVFATYATSSDLGGYVAQDYGFVVTQDGLGIATWDVGSNYEAFDLTADDTVRTVMYLLLQTDAHTADITFDGVGDLYGDADTLEMNVYLRTLANEVYTAINEGGDIA